MKATEFITEGKKGRRAVKYNGKPRNPVAHAAQKVAKGSGPHKDKKKADKQGDAKHKKELATMEASEGNKIEQLESLISQLEQLMPAVANAQKNHYEFEEMEAEMNAIAEAASTLSDQSAIVDITDAVENAVGQIKQANASIYEIEKTLKGLIKHAGYALDDARDEEQYESRFGGSNTQ
jgi:hypothetical protein